MVKPTVKKPLKLLEPTTLEETLRASKWVKEGNIARASNSDFTLTIEYSKLHGSGIIGNQYQLLVDGKLQDSYVRIEGSPPEANAFLEDIYNTAQHPQKRRFSSNDLPDALDNRPSYYDTRPLFD